MTHLHCHLHCHLQYRPLDFTSLEDCRLLARWENDPAIRRFTRPFQDEADFKQPADPDELLKKYAKTPRRESVLADLMVLLDGEAVGSAGVEIDPPHQLSMKSGTAWYGITLGEARARGRGLGVEVIRHLEDLSRSAGATQAEVGVFEYNEASIRLFEKLGYRRFGSVPEMTWWDGKLWTDLRYTKSLA